VDSVAIGVVPRDEPTRQNGGDSMMRAAGSLLFGPWGVIGNAVKEGTSEAGKQLYTQTRRGVNVVSEWRWNDCGRGSRHRALEIAMAGQRKDGGRTPTFLPELPTSA
jgi:hypothetical protein